jgi:hypothetical protein
MSEKTSHKAEIQRNIVAPQAEIENYGENQKRLGFLELIIPVTNNHISDLNFRLTQAKKFALTRSNYTKRMEELGEQITKNPEDINTDIVINDLESNILTQQKELDEYEIEIIKVREKIEKFEADKFKS